MSRCQSREHLIKINGNPGPFGKRRGLIASSLRWPPSSGNRSDGFFTDDESSTDERDRLLPYAEQLGSELFFSVFQEFWWYCCRSWFGAVVLNLGLRERSEFWVDWRSFLKKRYNSSVALGQVNLKFRTVDLSITKTCNCCNRLTNIKINNRSSANSTETNINMYEHTYRCQGKGRGKRYFIYRARGRKGGKEKFRNVRHYKLYMAAIALS